MGCVSTVWNKLTKGKEYRIMICGIDAAGKTTLVYLLKEGKIMYTIPTVGFNVETVKLNNISLVLWDTGGSEKIKQFIEECYSGYDGLIYVIDSSDTEEERLNYAKQHLMNLILKQIWGSGPLLVLCNKQDRKGALSPIEIEERMGLKFLNIDYHMQGTSCVTGEGIKEGFDWFTNALKLVSNNQ